MTDEMLEAGAEAAFEAWGGAEVASGKPWDQQSKTFRKAFTDEVSAAYTAMRALDPEWIAMREALEPFAALAEPKTWPDAPGETGPSRIDLIEGKDGTGELYLGTHFGTTREITLYRDDFEAARAALQPRQSK